MKEYQIQINDETIVYQLTYKHMQNIRMRVRDGQLLISAPYGTSLTYIEQMIHTYQKRILTQIHAFQPYYQYNDGGYVLIFNQRYRLVVRDIGVKRCQCHGHDLYVYHYDMQGCVEKECYRILYDYIEERMIDYLAHDFDLDMPRIEIKKYKSRWGSCYYKEQRVSFHLGLVHLEKELIDYVIVHELCHFLYHDHSASFYHEIAKRLPHYQILQKRLKEKHT